MEKHWLLYSLFISLSQISIGYPTRDTYVSYFKTVTIIEKPTCYIFPSSTSIPSCDPARKKRWAEIEEWPISFGHLVVPFSGAIEEEGENGQISTSLQFTDPVNHLYTGSEEYNDNLDPRDVPLAPVRGGGKEISGRIVAVDIEPSLTETPLKDSLTSLSWSVESRRLSPLIIHSTKFSTKTVAHTQRFLVDCIDSEEVYSPLCPTKRINKNWGYHGDHGPDKWSELEPICATGEEESPIALETNETISAELPGLEMKGYDRHPKEYLLQNNGHTLVVSLKDSILPSVKKGGLRSEYIFRQIHFHWGETSEEGSEHVINGKRYPMEIHLVHYNKKYGSVPKAVSHRDGLEVLAVFVEISDEANLVFEKMLSNLEQLISSNSAVTLPGDSFVLADFLPINKNFYRYHGSLTTPGCNQAVFWTIFSEPITMSEDQIDQFRKLLDHEDHPMSGNFRPLQRLYGREILRSF